MSNWFRLAKESRKSANLLMEEGHVRSTISRAYYAAYAKITMELIALGISMPTGREGPEHQKLRRLIEDKLRHLNKSEREALSRIVGRLYEMRLLADYHPSFIVEANDGRDAIALMKKVFNSF